MSALLTLIRQGLGLAWRYRWTFLVPVATLLLPATIYALRMPDEFEAMAEVHVSPLREESISRALPQEAVARAEELMATVRGRIFTRDNLQVVQPFLAPDAAPEDPRVLEEIAKAYDWDQVGEAAFTVALTKPDAVVAAEGVNRLLDAFLESERAHRLRRAERNRVFHEAELKTALAKETDLNARIADFRAEFADTLPDRKDAIQIELARLTTDIATQAARIQNKGTRIQALEERLLALATTKPPATARVVSATEDMLRLQLTGESSALNALEQALAEASAKYTEKHPDVLRLRSAVQVHRQAVSETTERLEKVRRDAQNRADETGATQQARDRKQLEALLAAEKEAMARASEKGREHHAHAAELTQRLGRIPATTARLQPLLDERDQAAKRVETRDAAATAARQAAEFYRSRHLSDVTDYQITARAVPPVMASGPGRWKYLLTAVAVGLLIGYGLLLLRHRYDGTTINSPDDLAGLFPAAVIVNVPLLGPTRRRGWTWRLKELGLGVYVVALIGTSAYFLAAHRGYLAKPEWWSGLFGGAA